MDIVDSIRALAGSPLKAVADSDNALEIFQHKQKLFEAAAEIERLRAALEFYANPEIYKSHPHGPAFDRGDHSWLARGVLLTPNARLSGI